MSLLAASMSAERHHSPAKRRRKPAPHQRDAASFNYEFVADDSGPEMGWRLWLSFAAALTVILAAAAWLP